MSPVPSRSRASRRARARAASLPALVLLLAGCGRLDELEYTPATTPREWCAQRPCVEVGGFVLTEPTSTVLVALLALVWLASGIFFLATRRGQRSRAWLGVALVLGGVGAAQAGVSYQALSYELKCKGWDTCRLTDGWEVGYSLTQALSVSAMVVAVAFACTSGRARRGMIWFAGVNAALYLVVGALGVWLPSSVLLSFTVLMLFALPGMLLVLVVALRRYRDDRDSLDRALVVAVVLLLLVNMAYFAYWATGVTASLWDGGRGFYFSENDVLHVGMIGWLAYVVLAVGPRLRDRGAHDDVQVAAGA